MIEMLEKDLFLEFVKYESVLYGVTLECIEQVAKRGKICVLTMEIEVRIINIEYLMDDV